MPTFDTPAPIGVTIELGVAQVWVTASDRTDTVVEVRPSDEADDSDVEAARQVRVDHTGGVLRVTGPKRLFDFSRRTRSVHVTLELPAGSHVDAHLLMGDVRGAGRLGECRIRTTGTVRLERTGALHLHTGMGDVTAGAVGGPAQISTGSGTVQVGEVEGAVEVKNSNGDTTIGSAGGDVKVRSANGTITVERAGHGVDVKTSHGNIRLGEVTRGSVVVGTAKGDLDIGIATGTAAWLEVDTGFGHVRTALEQTVQPAEADETVEVRGRTAYGDITIHRAA